MIRKALSVLALVLLPVLFLGLRALAKRQLVPQPRGMVLGMYAGLPDYDYREELERIAATGATCVSLQAIYRMEHFDSCEVLWHPTSSPTEESLRRTFHQARSLGLRMMFFPTINLRNEAVDPTYWRGNLQPRNWDAWWRNYTAFNVRLAALAQTGGVEWYSVGTEMASTHRFPERWRSLVAEVRKVYQGKITYSINFDSHDSFTFGDCLDVVGMNTYDPVAKTKDWPTPEQVRDAWWWIVYKARTLEERFQKPVMVTEVGYPSVAGAHRGPWDFRTAHHADPWLQDFLTQGAFGVLRNWSEGAAIFYYLYGENLADKPIGGMKDRTYAPWGKPVEQTLRDYYAQPIYEGRLQPAAEVIREAVVQVLASHHRKIRDYEDAVFPPWAQAWEKAHPEDRSAALAILALEPTPKRKIPKGREY